MVTTIFLPCGADALIDDADFELVKRTHWYSVTRRRNSLGVVRSMRGVKRGETPYLHRFLLSAKPDQVVDHIDGNGLNNQRANLRLCTQAENARNRKPNSNSALPKGVCTAPKGRFRVSISVSNQRHYLGTYTTVDAAARAYDAAAIRLHGEFARLNSSSETRQCA